ncbi:MAG: 5-methylthioadenosine/S-adenosylhomocysteine deaminase [Firmicutes bacterium ADurb.Bin193]|nr:MAG: 5-methylthioadenosine/S-adenosylhomocysteine deaminase [Firmicutes bacterium ADurb.Bin193]
MNILIKNAVILTMDDDNPLIRGDIGIADSKISFVGKCETFTPDRTVDVKGNIVMPGLVNAHTHSPMTLLRCYADDLALQSWLFDKIFPIEDTLTEDDIYWGSCLGCLEMISGGTTSFADMYFLNKGTAKAAVESGMRANISRSLQCFKEKPSYENDRMICEALDLYTEYNGAAEGRIQVELAPHAVYTNIPAYLRYTANLAEQLGAGVHTHISENMTENSDCMSKYGMTPTALFKSCGFFKTRTIAAHSVFLSDEDIRIYKEYNISIAHNPTSNLKLASGIAPIMRYAGSGINIALGTDGAASNNNLNMFEEIHLAALLQKGVTNNPEAVSAYTALKMATVNGAKALGLCETGVLKAGYNADLIVINTDKPHLTPYYDPFSAVAYSAQASDVESVMVGGRFLMERGVYSTLDVVKIYHNVKRIKGGIENAACSGKDV